MTKKASDVLARMKATAGREKPVSTASAELPAMPEAEPPAKPPRVRRVRFTLDLDPEQHKALKRFALEADADASEVMRTLLAQLQTDTALRNAVLTALSND
ncbi:hypothetical protein ACINK0_15770 [Deinococcus sp. VB343]|uniref:CopG family transcriptional regulator n=1 Tax=Deinococcus sp. VB142 TaxID=3112952 RepID=A0AAU6Q830_9DEIO